MQRTQNALTHFGLNTKPGAAGKVKQPTIENEAKSDVGIEQGALKLTWKTASQEYDIVIDKV